MTKAKAATIRFADAEARAEFEAKWIERAETAFDVLDLNGTYGAELAEDIANEVVGVSVSVFAQ